MYIVEMDGKHTGKFNSDYTLFLFYIFASFFAFALSACIIIQKPDCSKNQPNKRKKKQMQHSERENIGHTNTARNAKRNGRKIKRIKIANLSITLCVLALRTPTTICKCVYDGEISFFCSFPNLATHNNNNNTSSRCER